MKKGFYLFLECGSLCKKLLIFCIISLIISLFLIFVSGGFNIHNWYLGLINDNYNFRAIHAWILFFFMLSLVFLIINICINKICEDIARLLKENKNNYL